MPKSKKTKTKPKKVQKKVTPKDEGFVSLSEFAKLIGVDRSKINRALDNGIFSEASHYKEQTDRRTLYYFNPDVAIQEFKDYIQREKIKKPALKEVAQELDNEDQLNSEEGEDDIDSKHGSFDVYRSLDMKYRAKKSKLEYGILAGKYTEVKEVKRVAIKVAKAVKDAFLKIPGKLSAKVVQLNNNVHSIEQTILEEVNKTLESINWIYVQERDLRERNQNSLLVDFPSDEDDDDSDS